MAQRATKPPPSPAAATTAAPTIRGFLQGLHPNRVRGWAFIPGRPDEHVTIELRVDGALVLSIAAGMQFDDLHRNQIGKGDHGFLASLEHALPVDEPARIEVIALGAEGERLILQPPRLLIAAEPVVATADIAAAATTFGFTAEDRSQRPVFVLGAARSGTTAMAQALAQATRYTGHGEGHLMDLVPRLLGTVTHHYNRNQRERAPGVNTMLAVVPPEVLAAGIQHIFVQIARSLFPSNHWVEKTPGPDTIKAAPALLRIWPNARFIFLKRSPVDNIESRRRKFPSIGFREHCQIWADCMTAWEAVRLALAGVGVEIDQRRLTTDTPAVTTQVATLLALTDAEAARLSNLLQTRRPERTGDDIAAQRSMAAAGWTDEQQAIFSRICGPAMQAFGYTA